ESTLASPRLCISRGDSINCSGFGPEANGWLLRLPPVLQALHGFSMPPIALTPMLDKLADTSVGTITCTTQSHHQFHLPPERCRPPRAQLAPPDHHAGHRQHRNRHAQHRDQNAPRHAEDASAMDRRLQHVELLAQGALPRYFLAQQLAPIGAVED